MEEHWGDNSCPSAGGPSRAQTKAVPSAGSSPHCHQAAAASLRSGGVCSPWGAQICTLKLKEGSGRKCITNHSRLVAGDRSSGRHAATNHTPTSSLHQAPEQLFPDFSFPSLSQAWLEMSCLAVPPQ